MSKMLKNQIKLIGVALMAVIALGIFGTGAVIRHSMAMTNEVRTPTVDVAVKEEIGRAEWWGEKQKEVSFKNTGTTDVFIRVAYAESWIADQNGTEVTLPNQNGIPAADVATKNWTSGWSSGNEWQIGEDGWYYYKKVLKAGETTPDILESVTFPWNYTDSRYADAEYRLHFQVEAVQASDQLQVSQDAVKEVFGMAVEPKAGDDWQNKKYSTTLTWKGGSQA